jgi:pimeloyl-ACP methyl ester carboxylesterase
MAAKRAVQTQAPTAYAHGQIRPDFADTAANSIFSSKMTEQLRGQTHVNRSLTSAETDSGSWAAIMASPMVFPVPGRGAILALDADHLPLYRAVHAPILLLHRRDDGIVPIVAAERLHAEAGRKPVRSAQELDLPDELIEALDADPELAEAFHALTPGRRKRHVLHFSSAKAPTTRVARIERMRGVIIAGKGANER